MGYIAFDGRMCVNILTFKKQM